MREPVTFCPVAATSPEILVDQQNAQRAPTSREHIAALTGLRGFAALAVVLVHVAGASAYPWLGLHSYGPISLFVLSGFLLFQPWSKWMLGAGDRPRVSTFFKRRILRIFPPYLLVLIIVALIYPKSQPIGLDGWLRSLTLTQTFAGNGLRPSLEHTWSLSTEITWYGLLPVIGMFTALIVLRFKVRPIRAMSVVLLVALVLTMAWRWYIATYVTGLSALLTRPYWFPAFAVCFIGGALIGHLVVNDRVNPGAGFRPARWFAERPRLVVATVLFAGAIANSRLGGGWGWVTLTFEERTTRFIFTTAYALALLTAIGAAPAGSVIARFFSMRWLVATGRWSYGIYLWHLPVRELVMSHMAVPSGPLGFALWFTLILAISVPLGAASYAFVERPSQVWSKRWKR